jgi:rSAM/selenodomain-associated transferase 1
VTSRSGTVLVYLKYPEPGCVKTRLAATIGPVRAAGLYRGWIGQVLDRLQPLRPGITIIGAIDGARPEAFADWTAFVDRWWEQPVGDLGARLDAGFRYAHADDRPVLAIGTDCLELEPHLIREAFARLQDRDAVFGPTSDGGYYLVGTARYLTGFFTGIRWSTANTLDDHLRRCQENDWRVELLCTLNDIDTWDDWLAHCQRRGTAVEALTGP